VLCAPCAQVQESSFDRGKSMVAAKPWEQRWTVEGSLGSGGQGDTRLVRSTADKSVRGVLKTLRTPRCPQSRGRMFREVAALRTVHTAGGRVPKVLGDNTAEYESLDVPLYFVSEYIEGPTLAKHVAAIGPLSIDRSIGITLAICETLRVGHGEAVLHRDIKPENIVLAASDEPGAGAVVLDYGLSFNQAIAAGLTETDATFRNRFLNLPENHVPGGNRRDPRSDLAAVCGILYFCLTGEVPGQLQDEKGRAPHRRQGFSIVEKHAGDERVSRIELVLDCGFKNEIDLRFQTVDELTTRLANLGNARILPKPEDPIARAKRLSSAVLRNDRGHQLNQLAPAAERMIASLLTYVQNKIQGHLELFQLFADFSVVKRSTAPDPAGYEFSESSQLNLTIQVKEKKPRRGTAYRVGVKGQQCVLLRRRIERIENKFNALGDWQEVVWFAMEGPGKSENDHAIEDLKNEVNAAMDELIELGD
ncbi:MAG TPA: protein kinase, partial [Pirellulales bacterium]|nr:protein kinase [Pirellulales bacterium]